MPSPVTAESIGSVATQGKLCDRFKSLLETRADFKDFLEWLLGDDGELSTEAIRGFQSRLTPVGTVIQYAGNGTPVGDWLDANGQAVLRSEYPDLFLAIGTTWGAGDGVTTFQVPDLRGRVTVGAGATFSFASKGGEADITLAVDQVPLRDHYHGTGVMSTLTASNAEDDFWYIRRNYKSTEALTGQKSPTTAGHSANQVAIQDTTNGNVSGSLSGGIGTTGANDVGGVVEQLFETASHSNLQPYTVLRFLIKSK